MFESLLEKLLQSVLGKYILNFSDKSLSMKIWAGDINLENLELNPLLLSSLSLPFKLSYSKISKISLKIPWKNLSSSSVEINIENIFLIVELEEEKEWNLNAEKLIQEKLQKIDKFANDCLDCLLEKEKLLEKKGKDVSFSERMAMKILDNIQINIKNIHFRIESNNNIFFNAGFTLNALTICSTNDKWEKTIINRETETNKNLSRRKLLNLENFGFYWNSRKKNISGLNKNEIFEIMLQNQEKKEVFDYFINIDLAVKFIDNAENLQLPGYDLMIDLKKAEFEIKKHQTQDFIKLVEFLNKYMIYSKKNENKSFDKQHLEKITTLYSEAIKSQEKLTFPNLTSEDINLINLLPTQEILNVVKNLVKENHKMIALKKKIDKKKTGSFWSFGGKENVVTEEEISNLKKFYDENFSDEALNINNVISKPENYVLYQLSIQFEKVTFKLSIDSYKSKYILLNITDLNAKGIFRKNERIYEISLQNCDFTLADQIFFQKINRENLNFAQLSLIHAIQKKNQDSPDYLINFDFEKSLFVYNAEVIETLITFSDLSFEDQNLVDTSLEKIDNLEKQYAEKISKLTAEDLPIIHLSGVFKSPMIQMQHPLEKSCFIINLGFLNINTEGRKEKASHSYCVRLCETDFIYMEDAGRVSDFLANKKSDHIKLLSDFSVDLRLVKKQVPENPESITTIEFILPSLSLSLTDRTYRQILKLTDYFSNETKRNEEKIKEKSEILKKAIMIRKIWKRGEKIYLWSHYIGIYTTNHLYLFDNQQDKEAKEVIPLFNSEAGELKNKDFGFYVRTWRKTYFFAADDKKVFDSWMQIFSNQNVPLLKKKSELEALATLLNFKLNCKIMDFKLDISNFEFRLQEMNFELCSYHLMSKQNFSIKCLEIYKNNMKNKIPILSSGSHDMISINVINFDEKNMSYNGVDTEILVNFNELSLHYKPELIFELFDFFKNTSPEKEMILEEAVENIQIIDESDNIVDIRNKKASLVRIKANIQNLSVLLFAPYQGNKVGTASVFGVIMDFNLFEDSFILGGNINDVTITIHTSYPYEYPNNINDLILIEKDKKNNDSCLISFQYSKIFSTSSKFDSSLNLNLSKLELDFHLHPIQQLIDYVNENILVLSASPILKSKKSNTNKTILSRFLENPKFLKINVEISEIQAWIRTKPKSEGFSLIIHKIKVESDFHKVERWMEIFRISVDAVLERKMKMVARLIGNLEIEKGNFEDEYKWMDENIDFDRTIKIRTYFDDVQVILEKYDYDLLVYVTFLNLMFEDPNSKIIIENDKSKLVLPIEFSLEFKSLSLILFAISDPFASLTFQDIKLNYSRNELGSNEFTISSKHFNIKYFLITPEANLYIEKNLLNKFSSKKIHIDQILEKKNDKMEEHLDINFPKNDLMIKIKNDKGAKEIKTNISDIKFFIDVGFINISSMFFKYDPKLSQADFLKNDVNKENRLIFSLDVSNVSICVGMDEANYIATRGRILITYDDEGKDSFKISFGIKDFEAFQCNLNDLNETPSSELKNMYKRALIKPIGIDLMMKTSERKDNITKKKNFTNNTFIGVSDTLLKLSYRDLLLLKEVSDSQMISLEKSKKIRMNNLIIDFSFKEIKSSFLREITIYLPDTHFILINDLGDSYVPFIDFQIFKTQLNFTDLIDEEQTKIKKFNCDLVFNSNCHNAKINKWEPIIEKTSLKLDYQFNEGSKTKNNLDITTDSKFINFDISSEMLKSFFKGIRFLGMKQDLTKKEKIILENSDNVDYISSCIFKNLSGYPIEITIANFNKKKNTEILNKQICENGKTMSLHLLSEDSAFFDKMPMSSKVTVKMIQNENMIITLLKDLNLNKLFTNKHKDLNQIINSSFTFDKSTHKKTLTVFSSLLIKNDTQKDLEILYEDIIFKLSPSSPPLSIPYDKVSESFRIRTQLQGKNEISDKFQFNAIKEVSIKNDVYHISINDEKIWRISPKYSIKNALPLILSLTYEKEEIVLFPQQTWEIFTKIPDQLLLKVKIQNFEYTQLISIKSDRNYVTIQDGVGGTQRVSIAWQETNGKVRVIFYATAYLLNESDYDLIVFNKGEKTSEIAGQRKKFDGEIFNNKIVILDSEENIQIAEKFSNMKSEEIGLKVIVNSEIEVRTKTKIYSFSMISNFLCVDDDLLIYSKIFSILPRFIIVNQMKQDVIFRHINSKQNFIVKAGERKPYEFEISKKNTHVSLTILQNPISMSTDYLLSGELDISSLGSINVVISHRSDPSKKKYIKLDINSQNNIIFILVAELQENEAPFVLKNSLNAFGIFYRQYGSQSDFETLFPGEKQIFAWDYPLRPKVLEIRLESEEYEKREKILLGNLERLNETYQIAFYPLDYRRPVFLLLVNITLIGRTHHIEFIPSPPNIVFPNFKLHQNESKSQSFKLKLSLPKIGISLIQNTKKPFYELVYIEIVKMDFLYQIKKGFQTIQAKFNALTICNNSDEEYRFPNIFLGNGKNGFFNFFMKKTYGNSDNLVFYKALAFDVEPFTIKLERNFLEKLIPYFEFLWNTKAKLLKKSDSTYQECSYPLKFEKIERPDRWDWQTDVIVASTKYCFFESIIFSPFNFYLYFFNQIQENSKLNLPHLLDSILGLSLIDLEDINFRISGLKLTNTSDTKEGLTSKILLHYQQSFLKNVFSTNQFLNFIGRSNFIGNPISFFNNISTGVTDFIEKPLKGIIQGPLEGGKGVLMGVGSLAKNTIEGTFGAFGKITGSVGSGIASMTQDNEYLREREKRNLKKVSNIGEGLQKGAFSIFKGVGQGLTGLVMKPIEGADKEGAKGLFKGLFKGVTGLVAKPITGIFDATSQTAEGIKNTANFLSEIKQQEKKVREARVFYGKEEFYKDFNDDDVWVGRNLRRVDEGRFGKDKLLSFKWIDGKRVLILSEKNLVEMNIAERKVNWFAPFKAIEKWEVKGRMLKFYWVKKDSFGNYEIVFQKEEMIEDLVNELKEIRR